MKINIKFTDKTPNLTGPHLCNGCRYQRKTVGPRGEYQICRQYPETEITMHVTECNAFQSITDKSLKEMEDMAWIIDNRRNAGFIDPKEYKRRYGSDSPLEAND